MKEDKKISPYPCSWCGGEVLKPRRNWCSQTCVLEFTSRHHQRAFREFVWEHSDKRCRVCRLNLDALGDLLHSLDHAQRTAVRSLLGFNGSGFGDLWEADHTLPKGLGGEHLDPKLNGRVLCRRCHVEKTKEDVVAIKQFANREKAA